MDYGKAWPGEGGESVMEEAGWTAYPLRGRPTCSVQAQSINGDAGAALAEVCSRKQTTYLEADHLCGNEVGRNSEIKLESHAGTIAWSYHLISKEEL